VQRVIGQIAALIDALSPPATMTVAVKFTQ